MASRHVDVNERRLRPVYGKQWLTYYLHYSSWLPYICIIILCFMLDALDSLNNKKAIQHADKILKKQKDLHCAKVKCWL